MTLEGDAESFSSENTLKFLRLFENWKWDLKVLFLEFGS
jgi:hypothetical protein